MEAMFSIPASSYISIYNAFRNVMKALKQAIAVIIIVLSSMWLGCGNKPVLTEMTTNKLVVIIKGTYESNSPAPWLMPKACGEYDASTPPKCIKYTMGHRILVQDDSVNRCNATEDVNPSVFLIDIAEMRLADSQGNMHKFANFRQNFSFSMDDANPFFNGTGYIMDNDDVPSKLYPAAMIYLRKMLMDSAQKYVPKSEGWSGSLMWDVFAEKQYPCLNFNKMQVHSFYDSLRYESSYFNRVFPLVIPIRDATMGMVYNGGFPVSVLEIRFVIKNFVKKYEYQAYINDTFSTIHYYALSDWLQDVKQDEDHIGGNLLTVARSYVPGFVGTISGTNNRGYNAHIIAIPAGADITDYTIPGAEGTIPANPDEPYDGSDIDTPQNPRTLNPCDVSKKPSAYLGSSINHALDYYLRVERYHYNWNQKVPSECASYSQYKSDWNEFRHEVNNYLLPQLAVYAQTGSPFSFENVPPGKYDVYYATIAPRYGYLYYDGEFALAQAGVRVTAGGNTPVTIP